jgi:hypothetical protein
MSANNKKSKELNWPLYFGGFFFLLVIVFGMQWITTSLHITDWMKVTLGIFVSALLATGGIAISQSSKNSTANIFGQSLIGIGFGGVIVSLLFGGFAYDFYPREITALLTGLISIGWIVYSTFANQRIVLNLSLAGMFAVPIAWGSEHVWPAFLYVVITHAAISWTAHRKNWKEMNVIASVFAWMMLLIYAIGAGIQNEWIAEPLFILIAAMAYMRVMTWLAIQRSEESNMTMISYRPFIDVSFSLLTIVIFSIWYSELEPAYIIAIFIAVIGLLDGITSRILPHIARPSVRFYQTFLVISSISHLLLASFALNVTLDWDLKTHILMITWCLIAFALALIPSKAFRYLGWAIWIFTVMYGFTTTWVVPVGEWFGIYMPFLNTGALAWIITALVGYQYAIGKSKFKESPELNIINTVIVCFIIGGLLIVQTDNAFEAYGWSDELFQIAISGVLGIYALCWFLFSVFIKQRWMELISVILLGVIGLKALFWDLWNYEPVFKMFLFAALGLISFLMVWIDRRTHGQTEE